MINNLPEKWDLETDFISIGSGIGGLSAAITAHDNGARSLVLERSDQVGGVTALSMGEVWVAGNHLAEDLGVNDSVKSGFGYLKRLSMDYGCDLSILNKVIHAREALKYFEDNIGLKMEVIRGCPDYYYGACDDGVAEGRMLEAVPFPADMLGEWQSKTRISPQMPYAMTHHDIFSQGGVANMAKWDFSVMGERLMKDERCLGPGLAGYFVKGVLDRGIQMYTGTSAMELICDGERVVGVRAEQDGKDLFIKAEKGVLIAVSGYERNADYNKTLSQLLDLGSMVFSGIDGANFRLAGPLGARHATVPDITYLGFVVPGEEDEEGGPLWRSAMQTIGQPHVIVVNREGKRFGDESFYRQFYYSTGAIDGSDQTHPNFPCWMVFDSQAKEKYPIGPVLNDQEFPQDLGSVADSLNELAEKMGVDAKGLEETVSRFNQSAEKGEDPEFGRGSRPWSGWMCGDPYQKPNPNLGAVLKPPFYAIELKRMGGTGIPSCGLINNQHSQAVGWDDAPIEGLYVAGNSAARMETGAVMQSGISNARGMTHGYLAALHATGHASHKLKAAAQELGV